MLLAFLFGAWFAASAVEPPVVTVKSDNMLIDKSCRVEIPPGTVIPDPDNNGVIQIAPGGITVEFAPGSVLRGAPLGSPADGFTGTGIRLQGAKDVTLRGAVVEGYKAGIWATGCDGLTIEKADASGNFRQRLRSTPQAEDGADWMSFHHNDRNEALTNYGAAIYVEDSDGVTVRDCRVRRGQNGLILDRVNDSKVYDNDFSFLSGWGLGLWRSSRNTITRNAFDFCVRGHVEGVYNRGQDSAGIICFEQCSENVIAENSATHGGDCFFGFAGLEALNGEGAPPGFDFTRKGCNDNLLIDNDFSYAPAHGIEMTFSFGNKFIRNRLVENAICGIWGGYSQGTLIAENVFEGNGGMAYGLERGGINIEHGAGNLILNNAFTNNRCAIHLWWDPHADFAEKTWGKANYKGVTGNVIARNRFAINSRLPFARLGRDEKILVVQLRDDESGEHVKGNSFLNNQVSISSPRGEEFSLPESIRPGVELITEGKPPEYSIPSYEVLGTSKRVGTRANLRGRDKIIMTEWGPWDHESPLVRQVKREAREHLYELLNLDDPEVTIESVGGEIKAELRPGSRAKPATYRLTCGQPGVYGYAVRIAAKDGSFSQVIRGAFVNAKWRITVFQTPDYGAGKPPPDLAAFRALAKQPAAKTAAADRLALQYGGGGPSSVDLSPQITAAAIKPDHFGTIATAKVRLAKGRYRFKTLSDDGVRVLLDGKPVIENWTWHGPAPDSAEVTIEKDGDADITVEHFEIDGHAVLEFDVEPLEP
jgi:hypothetical protein